MSHVIIPNHEASSWIFCDFSSFSSLRLLFLQSHQITRKEKNYEKGKKITRKEKESRKDSSHFGLISFILFLFAGKNFILLPFHHIPIFFCYLISDFILRSRWIFQQKNAVFVIVESVGTRKEGSKTRNNIGKRQIESPLATFRSKGENSSPGKKWENWEKKKTMRQKVTKKWEKKNHLLNCGSSEASIDFTSTIVPTMFQTSYDRHDYPALWIHFN